MQLFSECVAIESNCQRIVNCSSSSSANVVFQRDCGGIRRKKCTSNVSSNRTENRNKNGNGNGRSTQKNGNVTLSNIQFEFQLHLNHVQMSKQTQSVISSRMRSLIVGGHVSHSDNDWCYSHGN